MPKKEEVKIEEIKVKAKGDADTLELLQAQPKMPVMIPVSENMEPEMVVINGCIYAIPRGKLVQVPQSIYEILMESQMKTIVANNDIKVGN